MLYKLYTLSVEAWEIEISLPLMLTLLPFKKTSSVKMFDFSPVVPLATLISILYPPSGIATLLPVSTITCVLSTAASNCHLLDVPFVSDFANVNESVLPFSKVIVLVLFKEKSYDLVWISPPSSTLIISPSLNLTPSKTETLKLFEEIESIIAKNKVPELTKLIDLALN